LPVFADILPAPFRIDTALRFSPLNFGRGGAHDDNPQWGETIFSLPSASISIFNLPCCDERLAVERVPI
jgi:hypothetical protein